MKKLLIIQLDEAYFLYETLHMLERYRDVIKDFQLTVLVDQKSLQQIQDGSCPVQSGLTTDIKSVLEQEFDLSLNFSLTEASWTIQEKVNARQKAGTLERDNQIIVPDAWSSYLLTLKARAPFLTFHMQDIYKNILGVRKIAQPVKENKTYHDLVFGLCNTDFFPAEEQEKIISLINEKHPQLKIRDISEIDVLADLTQVLYVGPASLEALKLCGAGATGIFLSGQFQGFNLLPHQEGHFFVSSRGGEFKADGLFSFIDSEIMDKDMPANLPYAAYQVDEENLYGSYLRSLNTSDDCYPIYQAHVVLWNFVLNLFDINLEVIKCSEKQIELLKGQQEVLGKLVRLYDYAMSSIDTVHNEARSSNTDSQKVQGHLKNLKDIEGITDKISQSHVYIRPILDFYRIRRGQNSGTTLQEQAQHSFLTYSEEHQALKATLELFAVTLKKNEVNI